jgi:hypothetical protein
MAANPPLLASDALDAIERLNRIHIAERIIFLSGGAAGTALLIYAAWLTIRGGEYDKESLGYFFGAGGAFATTGSYVMWQLRQSFALVRDLLLRQGGGGGT